MALCLKFTCFGKSVYLITDSEDIYNYYHKHIFPDSNDPVSFIDDLFPGINISEYKDKTVLKDYVVCFCHCGIKFHHIDAENNFAVISTDKEELNIRDVNVLLSTIISKKLNLIGKSFLHCAVIEKNGEATVLLGGMGAGKTSLAVYLCRYFNYRLLCNDHAIVGIENTDIPYVYSGTLKTTLRPGAVELVVPELTDYVPKFMMNDLWKTQFVLNEYFDALGIKTTTEITEIKHIFFVKVDKNLSCQCNKIFFKKNFSRPLLELHNYLGEFTRSNGKFLFGINEILPSFDDNATNNFRKKFSQCLIANANFYDVCGNINYVASSITKLY